MRIVLDTNVLARAAMRTSGLARELLLHCTEDPHVLVLSEFLISEVSRVLRYARMRKAHGLGDEDIEEYLGHLIPYAGNSDTFSNVWKLRVIRLLRGFRCAVLT